MRIKPGHLFVVWLVVGTVIICTLLAVLADRKCAQMNAPQGERCAP